MAAGNPTRYPKQWLNKRAVDVHRARAEAARGKPLPPGAEVHHIDGTKRADAQLVVCESSAYHKLLHVRMRIRQAGGNPNTDKICGRCGKVKPLADFYGDRTRSDGKEARCKMCRQETKRRCRSTTNRTTPHLPIRTPSP